MKKNIGEFFAGALINPVSILILIGSSFFFSPFYFTQVFDKLIGKGAILQFVGIYIWMIIIYAMVILLNYFILNPKKYVPHNKKIPFNDFLNLYFQSQQVYWVWGGIMVFPAVVTGLTVYMVGGGAAIFLVLFMYPFHNPIFKIIYLIFGFSLMIWSHRNYKKLARGEKIKNTY